MQKVKRQEAKTRTRAKLEQATAEAAVHVDRDQSDEPTINRKTTRRNSVGTGSAKANIAVLIHLQRLKNKAKAKLTGSKVESDSSTTHRRKSCTDVDPNFRLMKLSEGCSSSGSPRTPVGSMKERRGIVGSMKERRGSIEEHLPDIKTKDGQKSKFKVSSLLG